MVQARQVRASGETGAEEEATEAGEQLLEPMVQELQEEAKKTFRTPGFRRMRFDWRGEDRPILTKAIEAVEGRIRHNFADAFQVMYDVYDLVRTPLTENGHIARDQWGLTIWKRSASGSYEEDWTKLTHKQRENLLFQITTRIFEWEQRAADAWTEAMFAKAQFEERFAIGFDAPHSGTVDDRKAAGTIDSRDERYFAIFLSAYSRKADAVVRSMNLLAQRLKDAMTA